MQSFQLIPLEKDEFQDLFNLSDTALQELGAIRMTVDKKPGFPCRVSLQDAEIGEEVILLPYQHHKVNSPYQAGGPIFVRKIAATAMVAVNEIPLMFHHRLLSIRAYNEAAMMIEASVVEGKDLKEAIHTIFENKEVSYLHLHNAKPGCYNCAVIRVN